MRIPEPGPLGETFFDARDLAIVFASFVKSPGGGNVETVFTCPDHRFAFLLEFSFEAFAARGMIDAPKLVVALEKLNLALVLLRLRKSRERAQIAALAGSRILFARIEAELTGFEPADHVLLDAIPLKRAACSALNASNSAHRGRAK